jgi:hypothetical protein
VKRLILRFAANAMHTIRESHDFIICHRAHDNDSAAPK